MDNRQQGGRNMFGSYGSGDPSLNIPVTSSPNSVMSPYMNFDPSYVAPDSNQYIFPEGVAQRRGRFEMAFSQIGGSVFVGGAAGGINGLYSGFKRTRAEKMIGSVRRTQMLNSVAKGGASTAQTLGIVALMYSVFGTIIAKVRNVEDELNTVTAATLTGLLFKSSAWAMVDPKRPYGDSNTRRRIITSGMKTCLRGGATGFGLGTIYCLFTSRDRLRSMTDR